jgi:hypothetical protein
MAETTSHRNNFPMPFPHPDVAPTGGVGGRGQMTWSSRWSPDLVRFVLSGWLRHLVGESRANYCHCVLRLAVRHVDDDIWLRFSSSTM